MELTTSKQTHKARQKKHILRGKVKSWDKTIFRIGKGILIHFGRPIHHRVVRLSTRHLPAENGKGKPITWLANFGVLDSDSDDRFVKRIRFTVLLPPPPRNRVYVFYESGKLRDNFEPKPRARTLSVDFTNGDPGIGIRPKSDVI
jgi:hypothetical protein